MWKAVIAMSDIMLKHRVCGPADTVVYKFKNVFENIIIHTATLHSLRIYIPCNNK